MDSRLLVTGDKNHLYQLEEANGVGIVTACKALDLIGGIRQNR